MDSLEEIFQWQTPFCCTLLNDVIGPELVLPSLDAMLAFLELPEINLVPEQAHSNPVSIHLSPPKPLQIPLWPSDSLWTTSAVNSAIQAPACIRNPLKVNTKLSSVQTGTRGFEIPAPASPPSSAPSTPPVVKPKRSRGNGPAKSKSRTPKAEKGPAVFRLDAAEAKSKENRVPTTADHIIRERQRRDIMAAKYSILESLLPPAPKRERAVVVEDAISFVVALQQKKAQLLKRRVDLKLMESCNQSPWAKKTRSLAPLNKPLGAVANPSPCIMSALENSPLAASSDDPVIVTASRVAGPSASAISSINVHLGEEKIVMEMVCNQPRPNFQSALLEAVRSLGFDVIQCCIDRVGNGYTQCVITCTKSLVLSQRISEIQSSSTMIIKALRNMLTQS